MQLYSMGFYASVEAAALAWDITAASLQRCRKLNFPEVSFADLEQQLDALKCVISQAVPGGPPMPMPMHPPIELPMVHHPEHDQQAVVSGPEHVHGVEGHHLVEQHLADEHAVPAPAPAPEGEEHKHVVDQGHLSEHVTHVPGAGMGVPPDGTNTDGGEDIGMPVEGKSDAVPGPPEPETHADEGAEDL
jgi:hypothetical protein